MKNMQRQNLPRLLLWRQSSVFWGHYPFHCLFPSADRLCQSSDLLERLLIGSKESLISLAIYLVIGLADFLFFPISVVVLAYSLAQREVT